MYKNITKFKQFYQEMVVTFLTVEFVALIKFTGR